jgi:hypothetical protein
VGCSNVLLVFQQILTNNTVKNKQSVKYI